VAAVGASWGRLRLNLYFTHGDDFFGISEKVGLAWKRRKPHCSVSSDFDLMYVVQSRCRVTVPCRTETFCSIGKSTDATKGTPFGCACHTPGGTALTYTAQYRPAAPPPSSSSHSSMYLCRIARPVWANASNSQMREYSTGSSS